MFFVGGGGKVKVFGRLSSRKVKFSVSGLGFGDRSFFVFSVYSEGDCNRRTSFISRVWEDRFSSVGGSSSWV